MTCLGLLAPLGHLRTTQSRNFLTGTSFFQRTPVFWKMLILLQEGSRTPFAPSLMSDGWNIKKYIKEVLFAVGHVKNDFPALTRKLSKFAI